MARRVTHEIAEDLTKLYREHRGEEKPTPPAVHFKHKRTGTRGLVDRTKAPSDWWPRVTF